MIRTLLVWFSCAALWAAAPAHKTRNIVLVTADGLRWQEIFTGIDARLMNEKPAGMDNAAALRDALWRDTPEKRREALLPFFWTHLAPRGVVLGKNGSMRVTNAYRVSYPGYAEILTGRAQDDVIRGNDKIQNPTPTILEFLRDRLNLPRSQVALFGSWDMFISIGEHTPESIVINAGYEAWNGPGSSPRARELSDLQFAARTPWREERHDYVTFELALDYLKREHPRVLHIAFDETDDWAHDHRYDRVLESIRYFDQTLQKLWATLQELPEYRGRTTLVITSDHGRGDTLQDYSNHGRNVEGADRIWALIIGPDTPARGELDSPPEYYQRDLAPTMLELMGVPPDSYPGVEGHAIAAAIR